MAIDFSDNFSYGGDWQETLYKPVFTIPVLGFVVTVATLLIAVIIVLIWYYFIYKKQGFCAEATYGGLTVSPTGLSPYTYSGALAGGGPNALSSIFGGANQDLSNQQANLCSNTRENLTGNRGDPAFWEYSYDMQNAIARKVAAAEATAVQAPSTPTSSQATIQRFALREGIDTDGNWATSGTQRVGFGNREGAYTDDPLGALIHT